ncbi:MAG: thiamine biosynthesis protein [Proteobacteria bacterium]|nr:thiamine biosynthesis protein [Desulfobulbaceae bacterium]MBU4151530.1 thiamine biosynthesis protein [Pseudomonadota bacterium]MDP2106340.1 thiamine biosynthesis protein [Desulfobulbaceae bacterium]
MTQAIALFSGGLDSILACRVVARQGIKVLAVKFVTPFFDYDILERPGYSQEIKEKYDIDVTVVDLSTEYFSLLRNPAHGYGKHFNPCLDCKIFMMTKAREMMAVQGASFLISGEVLGQRPMSQRRDALRVVERDSGCNGILLRPLCAKHLLPTQPEINGLVDRAQLCDFGGRGRSPQIALAKEMGITDYPSPAGGCVLTDLNVAARIKRYYGEHQTIRVNDMRLIKVGRHFVLPDGAWLVMGRGEEENQSVLALAEENDLCLKLIDRPGPYALLRNLSSSTDLDLAAGLIARYGKKGPDGQPMPGQVECRGSNGTTVCAGVPPDPEHARSWVL